MSLTINLHSEGSVSGLWGRWARWSDGRVGKIAPDPMGSGRPVIRFSTGQYVRARGALTLVAAPEPVPSP